VFVSKLNLGSCFTPSVVVEQRELLLYFFSSPKNYFLGRSFTTFDGNAPRLEILHIDVIYRFDTYDFFQEFLKL
jgi:hypothetical protein